MGISSVSPAKRKIPLPNYDFQDRRLRIHKDYNSLYPNTIGEFDYLEPIALNKRELQRIRATSEAIFRVYRRVAELLKSAPREAYAQLGIPERLMDLVHLQSRCRFETVIGRLDLVHTRKSTRLLEFNADDPGLLLATFPLNAIVCRAYAKQDPNTAGPGVLSKAIRAVVCDRKKPSKRPTRVIFAYSETHPQDQVLARYLMSVSNLSHVIGGCHTTQKLTISSDCLRDARGSRIDTIWRLSPLDAFLSEIGRKEQHEECRLVHDLILQEKIRILNPPFAFLLESKAVQALIWNLCEQNSYFTKAEQNLIRKVFLPTFMDSINGKHVVKPAYGRLGDSIRVVDQDGSTIMTNGTVSYANQINVYQAYFPLPKRRFLTEKGWKDLNYVVSCFLIGGLAIGIIVRAGEGITDSSWWIVPVCVG